MSVVTVSQCPVCEEYFEEPGPAQYTCSRCGGSVVTEDSPARCEQCGIFMAKDADETCPECEEPLGELVEVERFEKDGHYFADEAEWRQWVKDTPKRKKADAAAKARSDALMEEIQTKKDEGARVRAEQFFAVKDFLMEIDPEWMESGNYAGVTRRADGTIDDPWGRIRDGGFYVDFDQFLKFMVAMQERYDEVRMNWVVD